MIDTSFTSTPEQNTNLYVRQVLQLARELNTISMLQFREVWGAEDKSPVKRLEDLANMNFVIPTCVQPVNLATFNEHMGRAYNLLVQAEKYKLISHTELTQEYRQSFPEEPTKRLWKIIPLQKEVEQAKLIENIITRALEIGILSNTQAEAIKIIRPINNREKVAQIYADFVEVFSKREEILAAAITLELISAQEANTLCGIKSTDPKNINDSYDSLVDLSQKIKAATDVDSHMKKFNELMQQAPSGLN